MSSMSHRWHLVTGRIKGNYKKTPSEEMRVLPKLWLFLSTHLFEYSKDPRLLSTVFEAVTYCDCPGSTS
jgi:hypothetical protein